MKERLYALFWEDRPARMKMYALALLVAVMSGVSEVVTTEGAMLAALVVVFLWTGIYCALGRVDGLLWIFCVVSALGLVWLVCISVALYRLNEALEALPLP